MQSIWPWVAFHVFIFAMLALDLGVLHREHREVSIKEALVWSAIWIVLALLFNVGVWHFEGSEKALQFLTGYILERSLSIDNIFVFILVFTHFKVPSKEQHRVLFWGILGALVMRALFIATGVTLIHKFHWIIYVFGVFLVFTGVKLVFETEEEEEKEFDHNWVVRLVRKLVPNAKPFIIVLLVIETTDVIFAMDSIPAILAVTTDPFIVYTSNIFAILGLRALYFAVAGMMKLFHYLNYGLAAILAFVGVKMLLSDVWHIPITWALGVIGLMMAASVAASIIWPKKEA